MAVAHPGCLQLIQLVIVILCSRPTYPLVTERYVSLEGCCHNLLFWMKRYFIQLTMHHKYAFTLCRPFREVLVTLSHPNDLHRRISDLKIRAAYSRVEVHALEGIWGIPLHEDDYFQGRPRHHIYSERIDSPGLSTGLCAVKTIHDYKYQQIYSHTKPISVLPSHTYSLNTMLPQG